VKWNGPTEIFGGADGMAGCWMLDVGCWMLDIRCWMLDKKHFRRYGVDKRVTGPLGAF
jgi:hypothetical protein